MRQVSSFVTQIRNALNLSGNSDIAIYYDELINAGMERSDIEALLTRFSKEGLIEKYSTGYTASEPRPVMYATFTTEKSPEYSKLVYRLSINKEKFNQLHGGGKKGYAAPPPTFAGELKPEIVVGDLRAYNDGSIRFKEEVIPLRNQLKDLLRLLMDNQAQYITTDDIKDAIIASNKRKGTSDGTITKYMSELRAKLKPYFPDNIILNQSGEGWRLTLNE
jgi:DNA-binding response OmpR family regulator